MRSTLYRENLHEDPPATPDEADKHNPARAIIRAANALQIKLGARSLDEHGPSLHEIRAMVLAHPRRLAVLEAGALERLRREHDINAAAQGEIVFAPNDGGEKAPRSYCALAPRRAWLSQISASVVFYCDRAHAVTSDEVYSAWRGRYMPGLTTPDPGPGQ